MCNGHMEHPPHPHKQTGTTESVALPDLRWRVVIKHYRTDNR